MANFVSHIGSLFINWDDDMFRQMEKSRTIFGALTIFCLFLVATSFFLQYFYALAPCLFCLLDRILVCALLVIFGVAFLHNPQKIGARLYSALAFILSLMGISITLRHLWLLHTPVNALEGCSPGLDYLLSTLPLKDVFLSILTSRPECSADTGYFLGLSIPAWTMLGFTIVALGSLLAWWAGKNRES